MSTLQVIERAALSLPREEQRKLLLFLTAVIEGGSTNAAPVEQNDVTLSESLHPDLLPVIGIIPAGARAEEIHEYRALKHS